MQADGLEPGTTYNFRYRVSNEDRDSFFEAGETRGDHRSDVRVHRRRERERGLGTMTFTVSLSQQLDGAGDGPLGGLGCHGRGWNRLQGAGFRFRHGD